MAMTEYSFTRNQCPDLIRENTASGNGDTAVQINIPYYAKRVSVFSESGNGCRIALYSDADTIHSDHIKVGSYGSFEIEWEDGENVANGITALYISNKKAENTDARKFTVVIEGIR